MDLTNKQPTLGLALSGGGNRSSFYIGFLEVMNEHNVRIDYITAMSGASLVAAAYACGTLPQFKERMLNLEADQLKELTKKADNGGFYSLEKVENELRTFYTKGQKFEEVRPHMSFVTVDIEAGEVVDLAMGDIARAACASCTLPGVFEPIIWGSRLLVDGGILSLVPLNSLSKFKPDIAVGVNMRGTKHIFSSKLLTAKKILNFFERLLFIDELEAFFENLLGENESIKKRGMFSVLGRSLDVVLDALKNKHEEEGPCDLMIIPDFPKAKRSEFTSDISKMSYEQGRANGELYVNQIKDLVAKKSKVPVAA